METGVATHGLLGAMVRNSFAADSSFSTGAYVEQVTEDGAANAAGIRSGDVVIEFAGERVTSSADLTALVRAQPAGAEVEVVVLRDGTNRSFTVTLGDAADLN
jgi:putative serine protease PepD